MVSIREQSRISKPTEDKLDIEKHTRFTIWDGQRPVGEFIVKVYDYTSESDYCIEKVLQFSEDGINLDYEETRIITEGFCKEHTEDILNVIATGEDGYVAGKYIKVLTPRFPSLKKWNPKFLECHEVWMKEGEFEEKVLDVLGEATYEQVWDAINEGKVISWRYISPYWYKESCRDSRGGCTHIQLFADGKNLGWIEDHPHREYKKLDDGRTVAVGEPTVYYDILLAIKSVDGYEVKTHQHWGRNLTCWIKESH